MKSVFLAIVLALVSVTACTNSDRTPMIMEIPDEEKIINIKCPDHCFCVLTEIIDARQFHYKARLLCGTKEIEVVPEPKETVDSGVGTNTKLFNISNVAVSQIE